MATLEFETSQRELKSCRGATQEY
jgi:hypothetical protein